MYQRWYKSIEYNESNKAVEIKAEVEVNVSGWGTQ